MADELWAELGATMRALRQRAGQSLRTVERSSGWGRGTLSQLENGRARPNREQVEWYDAHLGGEDLLMAMFAEARTARGPGRKRPRGAAALPGDAFEVTASVLASGESVAAGSTIVAGWTLRNTGTVPWPHRSLARVGAPAALRLISSAPSVPLACCAPGDTVEARFDVVIPDAAGMLAAYWHVVDDNGLPCFAPPSLLPLTLLAR